MVEVGNMERGSKRISRLTVRLQPGPARSYPIEIGAGLLGRAGERLNALGFARKVVVVTNRRVWRLHGEALQSSLRRGGFRFSVEKIGDGERFKSLETYAAVLRRLRFFQKEGSLGLLAFGGGVVGDLAGFVAGTFKRGVPCVQIPTTLVAQVDSAVGGKVAVNLEEGKNLVGLFYQPMYVLADVAVLKTLSPREFRAGLAEVLKYGFIADASFLRFLERRRAAVLDRDPGVLTSVVKRCLAIKAAHVTADERDDVAGKGVRARLNFGHTFGHALEAATDYRRYLHGEAVAIGMACAARLSASLGFLSRQEAEKVPALLSAFGLPVCAELRDSKKVLRHMRVDKKFIGGRNRFVVLESLGRAGLVSDVPWDQVREAMAESVARKP